MDRSIHIPVEFELTEGVRMLAEEFSRISESSSQTMKDDLALLYTFRLWIDWARQRKLWRPFRGAENVAEDPLVMVIEQACGFEGSRGWLVGAFLNAGILVKEEKDSLFGLRLAGFEIDNAHLLPGFKSMHQKGGMMKAVKQRLKDAEDAVPQARQLMKKQDVMLFPSATAEQDQDAALSLVMRIHTACGKPLPNPSEYRGKELLMKEALRRTKRSSQEEIKYVLEYLMLRPEAPKDPEIVLREFDRLLRCAIPAKFL